MSNPIPVHPGMSGADLAAWRAHQPGEYVARNGEKRPGWSQEQAADWYGVSTRQWQRYEHETTGIPLPLVKRMQAYQRSFEEALDLIMEVPQAKLDQWGSPFEQLKDEDSESRDITRPRTGKPNPQPVPDQEWVGPETEDDDG